MSITVGNGVTVGRGIDMNAYDPSLVLNLDAGSLISYPGYGGTWFDLSGYDNNATLVGDTPWSYTPGALSYFTFSSGVATVGNILPNNAYTKVGVFRVPNNFGNFISGNNSNSQHAFWGAQTQSLQSGHNGNWSTIISSTTVPLNRWVFGAVTFNTTTGWRLYLNREAAVTNSSTDTFSDDPGFLEIGGFDGNGNNLGGDVAVVQVYDRVLSDAEIANLYHRWNTRFQFESSFTISSSDFTNYGYGYHVTPNGTTGFTNAGGEGPGNNCYNPNLGGANGGNVAKATELINFWNNNGLTINNNSYVFNVNWTGGSPTSDKVVLSLYQYSGLDYVYVNIGTVYTGDNVWQTPGQDIFNSALKSAPGTYNFPATFTLYGPTIIQDNASWC